MCLISLKNIEDYFYSETNRGYNISGKLNRIKFNYEADKINNNQSLSLGNIDDLLHVRLEDKNGDGIIDIISDKKGLLDRSLESDTKKPEFEERRYNARMVWARWVKGMLNDLISGVESKWKEKYGKNLENYQDDPLKAYLK